ncbi:MAG: response regulator [Gemmatimonadetes bacterium]|nr:response regulator [Gemmatimonadota bacterium]
MSIPAFTNEPLALVVEDMPELRLLFSAVLRQAGFRVETLEDGNNVLAEAIRLRPDLICLDVVMPSVCGLDVCEQIRYTPATMDIPVLMMSVRSTPQDRANAELAGASGYLTKPVHPAELGQRARALLKRARV